MTDSTPQPIAATPSGPLDRLQQQRMQRWHQNGEALLTFENVRSWLNAAGLVLYSPRPQIPAPAPTFVEAVLGAPIAEPNLQQTGSARSLLARLIAEGIAVPLNLLGTTTGAVGDTPDYIASAGVFSYIFTLRGDKGWKQAPATSGATKVSQLAVHAYEILAKSQPRSASDLTTELGNAVTESAVLRALGELWTHLRVLPLPQQDGRATLWELASSRYTKQIKAGVNAGQPSALSALVSLYLGQVAVATEEEIEIFLSPLAPRSRTRDVLHALTAARQLDTVAIEGRTMLHLAGEAPGFLSGEPPVRETIPVAPIGAEELAGDTEAGSEAGEPGERIKKYVPKPRKIGTGPLAKGIPAKSAARPSTKTGRKTFEPSRGERSGFSRTRPADRSDSRTDRERRPFQKSRPADASREGKPRFDKPWTEDRPKRTPRPAREEQSSFAATGDGDKDRRSPAARGRAAGPDRTNGGWKPGFRTNQRPMREDFREERNRPSRGEPRSFAPRRREADPAERVAKFSKGPAGPKRPFRRTEEIGAEGERPARTFRRFDAPRPGAKRPNREQQEGQAPRPFRSRSEGRPQERGAGAAFRGRPAKFPAKRSGPPRQDGFASRPPRKEGLASRPPRKEGFASRPPRKEGFASRPPRKEGFSSGPPRKEGFSSRPQRKEGFSPRPRGEGFSARPRRGGADDTRPSPNKGTSGGPPRRRTFKREKDQSA